MDILTSDFSRQTAQNAPIHLIGWWCLFDTGEVWEWGRVVLTDVYRPSFILQAGVSETFLQQAANA